MRCVIVTGMSGAGKSTALKMLEDVGYFCVDNLPVPLIPKMADLLRVPGTELNKWISGAGRALRRWRRFLASWIRRG